MDFEIQSEIENTIPHDFSVTNIKVSVKLPKAVSLDFVVDRCSKIENPVYCQKATNNIVTFKYNNFTFVLFKSSSKRLADGSVKPQHCNITKCRTSDDILSAIQDLLFIVQQPPMLINYKIDNYSCLAKIHHKRCLAKIHHIIDIESLFLKEVELLCTYQEENFPHVSVRCPPHLTSAPNQLCQIYRTGSFTLVGGKILSEVETFFKWLLQKIAPYIKDECI